MGTHGYKARVADKLQVRHCNYHFTFWKENHKFQRPSIAFTLNCEKKTMKKKNERRGATLHRMRVKDAEP